MSDQKVSARLGMSSEDLKGLDPREIESFWCYIGNCVRYCRESAGSRHGFIAGNLIIELQTETAAKRLVNIHNASVMKLLERIWKKDNED